MSAWADGDERPDGVVLRLTADQRTALRAEHPAFSAVRDELDALGPGPGVRRLALGLAAAEAVRVDLEDLVPYRTGPHAPRLRAVLRQVEAALAAARARAAEAEAAEAAAAAVPPPPGPVTGVVYRFRVDLVGAGPAVWRRFDAEDCDLWELHKYLMAAVGWRHDIEPHTFAAGGVTYGPREKHGLACPAWWADERAAFVRAVFPAAGAVATYVYEVGRRGWRHSVRLQRVVRPRPGVRYPVLLSGVGAAPSEGGETGPLPTGAEAVAIAAERLAEVHIGLAHMRRGRPLAASRMWLDHRRRLAEAADNG